MSSTQMDLSPIAINRKQDIASWPEGDIDQLTARDKNRYQKRRAAIIDYFQSDLAVAEISSRHRLSGIDSLEAMARRCCVLHEDGQLWGFRALVPGARVIKSSAASAGEKPALDEASGLAGAAEVEAARAELVDQSEVEIEVMREAEDTAEREAIRLKRVAELPLTPIPTSAQEQAALESIRAEVQLPAEPVDVEVAAATTGSEDGQELLSPINEIAEASVNEEVPQEALPVPTQVLVETAAEEEAEEEVEQEDFPTAVNLIAETTVEEVEVEKEVEQEDFPAAVSLVAEPVVEEIEEEGEAEQEEFPMVVSSVEEVEEVEQEDFSATTSVVEESVVEEVEQEEFPGAVNLVAETTVEEVEIEEEVEQEDFPAAVSLIAESVVEEIEEEGEVEQEEFPMVVSSVEEVEEVEQEEFPEAATSIVEEVEQEKFPEAVSSVEEVEEEEEEKEVEQEDFPAFVSMAPAVEEPELISEEEEEGNEPTGKLSALRPVEQSADDELAREEEEEQVDVELLQTTELADVELLQTTKLETVQSGEDEGEAEKEEKEVEVKDESASAEVEVAELDTVEVALVTAEEHLNRVAATRTIKVPAAMLDALEKADQDREARTETLTDPAATPEKADAGAEDHPIAVQPVVAEAEETLVSQSVDDVTAVPTQTLEAWRRDSWQLSPAPAQSLGPESRYQITGSQAAIKHAVRRRWGKLGRLQKQRRWVRVISAAIVVSLLVILLIPLGVGLVGYNAYTNIKSVANDGINNLLTLKTLMPANKNDLISALNVQKLADGKAHLQKAQDDFLQLQDMVSRPDIQSLLQQFAPQYSNQLGMARHLVQVALDVTRMGQELIGVAQTGANVLHGGSSLLANSNTPLVSADEISAIQAALVHAEYYIGDIQTQMSQINLAQIPFGRAADKAKLASYLNQIPQALDTISQVQALIGPVAWMLGVGTGRHFLVQTLDRGELRPSGGFEGQYGVLTLQDGRMSPFSLTDIAKLDYGGNGAELNATPPSQYSWMNFGNFGVRDANLSADFPTTAKIVMGYFQQEGGGPVDGDIQVTPVVIEQFLQITGPIRVAEYNDTVTAQNLETKLHAYQQDPRLIAVQQNKTGQDTHQTRKAFTNLLGKLIMDRAKHLPFSQLIEFGKVLFKDLKSRDLQIYLNNPVAEQWLQQNQDDGAMPRFINGIDGFMVVQANISISKAAQFVKTTFNDQVTLNADGSATHDLTIILNYQQKGPVYGFDSYADYLRVYAPKNAQLRKAYGFNTGATLCTPGKPVNPPTGSGGTSKSGTGKSGTVPTYTGGTSGGGSYTDAGVTVTGCSQYYNSFPDETYRYCADGNYRLGYNGMQAKAWAVQALGDAAEKHSDLPGYSMWGGMTLTPKNCISKIELIWSVPNIVQKTPGQSPYQMIVGHQAGWPDHAQISIDASALKGVKPLNYDQTINVDTLVALANLPGGSPTRQKPGSTPTPAVTPTATPKKP